VKKKLKKENDLTLVFRLSRDMKINLKKIGIMNLQDLAKSTPEHLTQIKGIGENSAKKWILQSQSLIKNKPIIIKRPTFVNTNTEIFFDIEGETEMGIDYLYGFPLNLLAH